MMDDKIIGFNLTEDGIKTLLENSLKPEEIAGDAAIQLKRVNELIHWFVRLAKGSANPKWATRHAFELAYYVASMSSNRFIDLDAIEKQAWLEGVNISPEEKFILEKLNTI